MKPSLPLFRRGSSVTSQLGLSDRIFSSAKDRGLAAGIDAGLEQVEASLLGEIVFTDEIANVTTRYLLNAGGKRVRPMLALLTAHLGNGNLADVVTAATAIEITHLASLYHDDVMDDADQRRGVPSAQIVWGNSVAILTGDLLFARANQLMARLGERAIRLQSDTFERLVLGQLHETVGPRADEDAVEHYIQVLADKTGSLIACAAQAGIIFSDAPDEFEQPVIQFGERIGVAFQLIDDVLDLSPQPLETGKVPGTDLRAGVATLPLLRLRERAQHDAAAAALLERLERDVMTSNSAVSEAADSAITALREHDVTAQTLSEAHGWAHDAVEALAPLPDGSVKKALTRFADTIVERSS
ncbi:polyprenyl synthetase family protein [Cryobacterium sp. TMT1-21]|uniref:Polyprenyl synthetase family protein n=1 Tax=Cryobacterium shii TaxID=1259235 RepID=A0AAQ2HF94_9MICO|nr:MULTISPECIES: polyprenyl synthetase family protein [Cryobacterium]TFC45599.1 polyprenyl synthetase family protein [Cryobacterium shii]TFC85792.1 polyprenyl synthetase family protein [Cryobacterium sp. TmT2-59]TFD16466.1 polyprenyl synthetase family protein [Cryobacterium sp. TMT1-21]TFD16914.1 polyprenyl synthetase family protein [Cryobacterium sp. TMT4-10]TFD23590.1 polyprenyl synthetase family protein [Cryobacterium sp. TMT2-23]